MTTPLARRWIPTLAVLPLALGSLAIGCHDAPARAMSQPVAVTPSVATPLTLTPAAAAPAATAPAAVRLSAVAVSAAASLGDAELIATPRSTPQPDSDERTHLRVTWRAADGSRVDIETPRAVTAAVAWDHGAALLDVDGDLWRAEPRVANRRLASNVVGEISASSDRRLLAYVTLADVHGELHVATRSHDRVVATGLQSAGMFRFDEAGARLAFVGAHVGGVSGLRVLTMTADAVTESCLTNCALRTGQPFGAEFEAPPIAAEQIEFAGDRLRWRTPDGPFTSRGLAEVGR